MPSEADITLTASELRIVLGQLVQRLRAEHRFPLLHGAVLGRLDRETMEHRRPGHRGEGSAPDDGADDRRAEESRLVQRHADPATGERPDRAHRRGRPALEEDQRHRVGWLVSVIERLSKEEQRRPEAVDELLRRLAGP